MATGQGNWVHTMRSEAGAPMTGALVDRKHTGQARTQRPWPEAKDTLGVMCDPPGRAAGRHRLPAPQGQAAARTENCVLARSPAPRASARVLPRGAASSSGHPSLRPCARSAVIPVPRTGSGAQGRAATDTSGVPLGLAGPRPRGCGKAQDTGQALGLWPLPGLSCGAHGGAHPPPHWPPGTPLPGSNESGSTT